MELFGSHRKTPESSWKRAYIRRHNPDFPQEEYTNLPCVPYHKKHRYIQWKHELKAIQQHLRDWDVKAPPSQSLLYQSGLLLHAFRHGVDPQVEAQLSIRGWVLCQGLQGDYSSAFRRFTRRKCHKFYESAWCAISERNQIRQKLLREAEIGARSSMAQVPLGFDIIT